MTLNFVKATVERAVKTFAQSLAALLTADGVDLLSVNWGTMLSVSGMAALVSLLTSVGSDAFTTNPGPSLTAAEQIEE